VFTLPSYNEGLPMSMLEAMAAGKAVVVTPVGGIPEAVQDHENGLLVPIGDVDQLVYAFRQLFSDVALRRTWGQGARHDCRTLQY
jgi:glycosyltransferase involved in cell wall biosynthesis